MLVILEGEVADKDDDLTTQTAHFHALLEIFLRIIKDEQ